MNIGMLLHVRFLMEPFTTVITRIWSSITVYQQMRGKCAASFESLCTLWTLKIFLLVFE